MSRLVLMLAIMALSPVLSACSPSQPTSHKPPGETASTSQPSPSDQPKTDGSWTSGVTTDEFSDKQIHVAASTTDIDDGHNGKMTVEIKYTDGESRITMSFQYLNDLKDQPNPCDQMSFARQFEFGALISPVAARNESGDLLAMPDTEGTQNCNAVTVQFGQDSIEKILQSADLRVKLALANGMNPVMHMDFQNNGALHEFAAYVSGKLNAQQQAANAAAAAANVPTPSPDTSSAPTTSTTPPVPDDVMASRYGNTVISRTGTAEWHLHYQAGGTFSGKEINSGYSVQGLWELKQGELCRTFQPPLRGTPNPDCQPIEAHSVGDTWTSGGNAMSLVQGFQ